MTIVDISKNLQSAAVRNSPQLLTGLAASGAIVTTFLTGRAFFRVGKDVNAGHYEPIMAGLEPESYTPKQLVKTYWREFVPPAIALSGTLVCIFGANTVHTRRNAALAAAYGLSEAAFREYKDKVVEQLGAKAETKVVDAIAQDKLDANPPKNGEIIFVGSKEMLCYETITGRYFHCDMETLRKAENTMNLEIINEMYVSLNEWFDKLGLEATSIGEDLGWTTGTPLEVQYSSMLATDVGDGKGTQPCMVIGYRRLPIPEYNSLH